MKTTTVFFTEARRINPLGEVQIEWTDVCCGHTDRAEAEECMEWHRDIESGKRPPDCENAILIRIDAEMRRQKHGPGEDQYRLVERVQTDTVVKTDEKVH